MKTRYLLAGLSALAFASGTAHAQNQNTTSSSGGTGNTAACTNAGGPQGNICNIEQIGSDNGAQVIQTADDNEGEIIQTGNANTGTIIQLEDNYGRIQQVGNNNVGFIGQSGSTSSTATITQNGNGSDADIRQRGANQAASVSQTAGSSVGSGVIDVRQNNLFSTATALQDGTRPGNSATVTQGAYFGSSDADIVTSQNGSNNTVSVTQNAAASTVTVTQGAVLDAAGDAAADSDQAYGNSGTVSQSGYSQVATLTQSGDNNTGSITQTESSGQFYSAGFENRAGLTQSGNANTGSVSQIGAVYNYSNSGTVVQSGSNNNGSVSQSSLGFQVSNNTATVTQSGNGNTASVVQNGEGDVRFNTGTIEQAGTSGSASISQTNSSQNSVIRQFGSGARASTTQSDLANGSTIVQRGGANTATLTQAGTNQVSDIRQAVDSTSAGNGNRATVSQNGASSNANNSLVSQGGRRNSTTVTQTGQSNSSSVTQAFSLNATADNGNDDSWDNSATVTQTGNNLNSVISQVAGNGAGFADANRATVILSNNGAAALTGGVSNSSSITQQTSGNLATVILAGGATERNTSLLVQRNGSSTSGANEAFVSLNGNNLDSDIDQNGDNNYAEVTMTGGVTGDNVNGVGPEANLNGGNTATIDQTDDGSTAVVNTQPARGAAFRGLGNAVTINQTGASFFQNQSSSAPANLTTTASEGRRAYTEFGRSNNFTGSRGNYVETWQQGRFDTANITQTTGTQANGSGFVYADGQIGRARAGVYQDSSVGVVNVNQNGDNYGEVTQAFGQASSVSLTQTDAGDTVQSVQTGVIPGTPCTDDGFGNCVGGTPDTPVFSNVQTRQYNQSVITQYGNSNEIIVEQNARNAYADVFQRAGSQDLYLDLQQGTSNSNASAAATPVTNAITALREYFNHRAMALAPEEKLPRRHTRWQPHGLLLEWLRR